MPLKPLKANQAAFRSETLSLCPRPPVDARVTNIGAGTMWRTPFLFLFVEIGRILKREGGFPSPFTSLPGCSLVDAILKMSIQANHTDFSTTLQRKNFQNIYF
jgi:hypothetical protein